ncbi:MAG: bacteriohemerythrin [Spirochaetota bacterium]
MKLRWEEKFSVHVKEIDDQHKKLFAMINELIKAKEEGRDSEIIGHVLFEMVNYLDIHFKTEEKYMVEFGYAEYKSHLRQHSEFVQKTLEFGKKYRGKKDELSDEVLSFLIDWVIEHVLNSDSRYSDCFIAHGLA